MDKLCLQLKSPQRLPLVLDEQGGKNEK